MGRTQNYNLYVTDDGSEKFSDWRTGMNGTKDSNMTKIDAALGEKADRSQSFATSLLASEWVEGNGTCTQSIAVEGLDENQNGVISLAQSATIEQRNEARIALLSVVGQSRNMITVAVDGEIPTLDIPVVVIKCY